MPEPREDASGDIQQAHEGTGAGDQGRDGLGARTSHYLPHPA
ncbi:MULTISPECIES: hypothetical protein [unclassified Streptomyces]|nr:MULTISPECIES: hypothetical protein [unclassified Streptomyces]WSN45774.1 hypothetical protein OG736_24725 [Streptomyces sp. NBC_01334]